MLYCFVWFWPLQQFFFRSHFKKENMMKPSFPWWKRVKLCWFHKSVGFVITYKCWELANLMSACQKSLLKWCTAAEMNFNCRCTVVPLEKPFNFTISPVHRSRSLLRFSALINHTKVKEKGQILCWNLFVTLDRAGYLRGIRWLQVSIFSNNLQA